MKMKRLLIIVSGLIISIALHGCSGFSEPAIKYENHIQKVSTVENILADKLEVENPDLDIDVQIQTQDEKN